jgi:hypothetical protein
MTDIAKDIIHIRDTERLKQASYWSNLWQDAADLAYPNEDQINTKGTPGEDQSTKRLDDTGVVASQKMASGMLIAMVPVGQKFFGLALRNTELNYVDVVRRWLMLAAEIMHYELYDSNFRQQLDGSLRSAIVFGGGCLFSEFQSKVMPMRLNFRDHAINLYQIKENFAGQVDTVIFSYKMTARQMVQEFGGDTLPSAVIAAASKADTESQKFEIIHYVCPRKERDPSMKDNRNMPWASYIVDVKSTTIIKESGYKQMPFHVFRWSKRANEKYGRGPGTDCLARMRMLNKMESRRIDLANRFAHPPYLQNSTGFEGDLDVTPDAVNMVSDINNAVKPIDPAIIGNFPITQNEVDAQRKLVKEAFYQDVFAPITDLPGDRRTTVEIQARIQEGLRQLGSPVGRMESELLNPLLERTLDLLIQHGRIPMPPPQLAGQAYSFEYTGQLALALRDQQARGFMQFAQFSAQIAEVHPEALDSINFDKAMPDVAESMGVKEAHLATQDEMAAKRQARAQQVQQQQAIEAAKAIGGAYAHGTKAPEDGSASQKLLEGAAA